MPAMFPILYSLPDILASQLSKKGGGDDINSNTGWDWGWRTDPISGTPNQWHNGVDLPAPTGTPIFSPWDGVVKKIWQDDLNGNGIQIEHSDPDHPEVYFTGYAHMSAYGDFKVGDSVKAGDTIGYIGSTGASTGPHSHFVVFSKDTQFVGGSSRTDLDPLPYLEAATEGESSYTGSTAGGMGIVGGMLLGVAAVYFLFLRKH
jgi:murein DD-endopeptidase MepM/ murein hydrolase activator NlpD